MKTQNETVIDVPIDSDDLGLHTVRKGENSARSRICDLT